MGLSKHGNNFSQNDGDQKKIIIGRLKTERKNWLQALPN